MWEMYEPRGVCGVGRRRWTGGRLSVGISGINCVSSLWPCSFETVFYVKTHALSPVRNLSMLCFFQREALCALHPTPPYFGRLSVSKCSKGEKSRERQVQYIFKYISKCDILSLTLCHNSFDLFVIKSIIGQTEEENLYNFCLYCLYLLVDQETGWKRGEWHRANDRSWNWSRAAPVCGMPPRCPHKSYIYNVKAF